MYAGPGSASLVAAAKMWDSVASDLFSAASAFQSVVWGLTVGSWIGSSAANHQHPSTDHLDCHPKDHARNLHSYTTSLALASQRLQRDYSEAVVVRLG